MAGPLRFEAKSLWPSEGLRLINKVSTRRNHSLETLFTIRLSLWVIIADNLETSSPQERLIAPTHIVSRRGLELSKVIRVRYEKGVLKPLGSVDLEEGKEYKVIVEEDIDELIEKYRGVLGKSSVEEFRELEEEAQAQ